MSEEVKPDPNAAVRDLMKRMKGDIRQIINNYTNECSTLATKSADPHTPVLQMAQMALANAAVDYMVLCGAKPPEALQIVSNATGVAMQQWIETILRLHNLKAKTSNQSIIIENAPPSLN